MSVACADAVASGVSATDNEDVFAFSRNTFILRESLSCKNTVLLCEQFEGEMDTFQFTSGNIQVASLWGASTDAICVETIRELCDVDFSVDYKFYAFLLHNVHPSVDDSLVKLKVRNAESKESADVFEFFKNSDIISHFVEVVSSSKSGGTGADDGNFFPVTVVFLRLYEPFTESSLSDSTFVFTNSDRSVHAELKNATHFAESRANTPSKLRKVVSESEYFICFSPFSFI